METTAHTDNKVASAAVDAHASSSKHTSLKAPDTSSKPPVLVGMGKVGDNAVFAFGDGHTEEIAIADINKDTLQSLITIVAGQSIDDTPEKPNAKSGKEAENVQAETAKHGNRKGMNLIELLTCTAVIGVALSLLLPAVQMARESARKMSDKNNEKQVALTLHNFESTLKHLPNNATPHEGSVGGFRESAFLAIAPYMEGSNFVQNYDEKSWYFSPENASLAQNGGFSILTLPSFQGSSDLAGSVDIGLIAGANVVPNPYTKLEWPNDEWQHFVTGATVPNDRTGAFLNDDRESALVKRMPPKRKLAHFTDGLSNTIVIAPNGGSVAADADPSVQVSAITPGYARISAHPDFISERDVKAPEDPTLRGVGTRKDGTTTVAYADGHVEDIDLRNMDKKAWQSRITINSGEVNDSLER